MKCQEENVEVHHIRAMKGDQRGDSMKCQEGEGKHRPYISFLFHCCSISAQAPRTCATSDSSGSRPP